MSLYITSSTLNHIKLLLFLVVLCHCGTAGRADKTSDCRSRQNETRSGRREFPSVNIVKSEDNTVWSESHPSQDSLLLTPSNGSGQVVSLALVCTASYPVQWSFAKYQKWIPWSVTSGRGGRSLETRDAFQSWLRYPLMRNITQIRNDLPTCHKAADECVQTSISVNKTALLIQQGTDLTLNPDANFGKNVGCKLRIAYDKVKGIFYCHSLEPNATLTMFPVPCSDPTNCRSVFMNSVEPCSSDEVMPYRGCKECVKMTYSSDYLPGAAVCIVRGLPDEATLEASVAVPFVYSLKRDKMSQASHKVSVPTRYLNWKDIRESEMMQLTKFDRPVYAGETILINCNASYYYFGSGFQIDIHKITQEDEDEGYTDKNDEDSTTEGFIKISNDTSRTSGEDSSLMMGTINEQEQIITDKGSINGAEVNVPWIRSFTAQIITRNPGSYRIQCKAPVWNSTEWVSEFTTVTILPSFVPRFLKGNGTERLIYKPELKLECSSVGVPKPILEWNQDGRPLPLSIRISRVEEDGNKSSSTLSLPSNDRVYGNFTCVAYNSAGTIGKVFSVIPPDPDSTTIIIIMAVLAVAAMVLIPAVLFLIWKVNQQKKQLRYLTEEEVEEFIMGKPDFIPFQSDMSTYAYYLPYDKSYEIAKEDLEIDFSRILGQGAYGMVIYGYYKPSNDTAGKKEVAIKTSKPLDDGIDMFKALLSELKIMTYIGRHDNIVNLMGACTQNIQKREVFIALEFCENGSLLSYLRINRHSFLNPAFKMDSTDKPVVERQPSFISQPQVQYVKMEDLSHIALHYPRDYANTHQLVTMDLVRWAHEIAEGMDFLVRKKVIHGDLAARNILLTSNRTAKVGDFGLSKRLMHYNSYTRTANTPLPIKWLALECLQDFQFSTESDVWSYGVTLWELFSLGEIPYSGFNGTGEEFLNKLCRGMRLSQPIYCSPEIFDVMMSCWRHDRKQRPTFELLSGYFKKIAHYPSKDERPHPVAAMRLSGFSKIFKNDQTDYPSLIDGMSFR